MADWIWNAAIEKGIADITIDILNNTVEPADLQIEPIVALLPNLKTTIDKTLNRNGFPTDFIAHASFKIYISQKYKAQRLLTCQAILVDKEGKIYIGKTYTEKALEDPITVFSRSIFSWLFNPFKKRKANA